ncbi:flagellar FlbD family protein, partial [Treponema pallidum]
VNPHHIETMRCTPDVTLQMLSGKCYVVRESVQEVIDKIVSYRRSIGCLNDET